jgi:GAF domain-containing protein
MPREALLVQTFVELADTLVDDFDVVDLLTALADHCVEALDVTAAGLMVATPGGELRVVASSSDKMRVLELFELQTEDGPCPECYRTATPIVNELLDTAASRWPLFAPRAVAAGFHSVHALPMRLRGQTIGALNLFRSDAGNLNDADVRAAQAFADVATIAVLQQRAAAEAQLVNEQLSQALNSRVTIEQAKGMIAERTGADMPTSFARLRGHARNHNLRLLDVAQQVIDGTIAATSLDPVVPKPRT